MASKDVTLRLVIQSAKDKVDADLNALVKSLDQIAQAAAGVNTTASQAAQKTALGFQNASKSAQESSSVFGSISNVVTAVATSFMAVTQGLQLFSDQINRATSYISEGIAKWSDAALAAKQLQIAWEGSKRAVPLYEIREVHSELIKLPNVTRGAMEETTKLFAGLEQIPDAMMPRMLKLTADIAAFTGRDFETAGVMMSRVAQGNFEAMSRIGLRVSEAAKASGNLNVVIGEIEKRVSGMGVAALGTWEGKTADIAKQWSVIQKTVGSIIGSALLDTLERIRAKTEEWAKWLSDAEKAGKFDALKAVIAEVGRAFVTIRGAIADTFGAVGKAIANAFGAPGQSLLELFAGGLRTVTEVIVKIITFIGNIGENKFVIYATAAAVAWKAFSAAIALGFSLWERASAVLRSIFAQIQVSQNTILGLINAQTAALDAQTSATARLSAANQKRINDFMNSPAGQTVLTTGGAKPTEGAKPPLIAGMGKAVMSSAAVGLTAAAFGASPGDIAQYTALNFALQLMYDNMGKITAAAALLGTRLLALAAGAGDAIAAFLGFGSVAGVVTAISGAFAAIAVKAGALGTILTGLGISAAAAGAAIAATFVAGVASWGYVIYRSKDAIDAWRSSAKDSVEDSKRMQEEAKKAGATGDKATRLTDSDLAKKDLNELRNLRKTATNEYQLQIGKEAEAIVDGDNQNRVKAENTKKGYRENIDLITKYINKILEEQKASTEANKVLLPGNIFSEAAIGFGKMEDRMKIQNDLYDTLTKKADAYWSILNDLDTISLGNLKNEITATTQSEQVALTAMEKAETTYAAKRIANTKAQFAENAATREQIKNAQLADISAQMSGLRENSEEYRKLQLQKADIQKRFNDETIAAEKQLQAAIIGEIQKQADAARQAAEKRKKIEQEVKDEIVEAQRAVRDIYSKSMDDVQKLALNYMNASESLKRANESLSAMPEKAIELARKARDEFKSLTIDLNALQKEMNKTFRDNTELLREFAKKDMSPAQQWVSDVEHVNKLLTEAQNLMVAGKFKEAQELASQAKRPASELRNASPETGVPGEDATKIAGNLLLEAVRIEEAAQKAFYNVATTINKGAAEKVQDANQIIKDAQARLLDENTKALDAHAQLLQQLIDTYKEATAAKAGGGLGTPGMGGAPGAPSGGLDVAKYGDLVNYGAAAGAAAAITQEATRPETAQTFAPGKESPTRPGYEPMKSETEGYSVSTGTTIGSTAGLDAVLAQTDALLAQSRQQSADSDARAAKWKELESINKNLDHKMQMGYITETPGGYTGSKADLDLIRKRDKLWEDINQGDNRTVGQTEESAKALLAVQTAQASAYVDQYLKEQQKQTMGIDRGSQIAWQGLLAGMPVDIRSMFGPQATGVSATGEPQGGGDPVVERTRALEGAIERFSNVLDQTIEVTVAVSDNRDTETSISRIGDRG